MIVSLKLNWIMPHNSKIYDFLWENKAAKFCVYVTEVLVLLYMANGN